MNERVIRRLEGCGATLFRINLSHTALDEVEPAIQFIKKHTEVPICLDTEGAQIRTGPLVDGGLSVRDNTIIRAHRRRVPGDDKNFNLYPANIIDILQPGDFLSIDFNAVLVQVIGRDDENTVKMLVLNGGGIGQNKAVTLERPVKLPPLTEKDRGAIEIGRSLGLNHFALSFANHGDDVEEIGLLREKAPSSSPRSSRGTAWRTWKPSPRVRTRSADRSRRLVPRSPDRRLPSTQKAILRRGRSAGVPVYVATNLLESMVTAPNPTRAEVNDIHNTLLDGADGLVLAAETAIGAHPIACASMISRMIEHFEHGKAGDAEEFSFEPISQLVPPHGGSLVAGMAPVENLEESRDLPSVLVSQETLLDCEQIANGTYSPVSGFMDRETLESVLNKNRLPNGEIWTLPITLQIPDIKEAEFGAGDRIALTDADGGNLRHHGCVRDFRGRLGGCHQSLVWDLVRRSPGRRPYSPCGKQVRGRGYRTGAPRSVALSPLSADALSDKVCVRTAWLVEKVAFHGRNPAHRAHEAIQIAAIERSDADGLYINPVLGPKKSGDFCLAR